MAEIVYYDDNPTVRHLMARKFTKYGLSVSIVPALEQCEEVFKNCRKPVIFIADLSRHPDYLPILQRVVPRYIDDSARCILTSLKPRELAPYLLPKLEENFFSHVVERPFKTQEFMNFFDDVARLCPNTTCFVHDQPVSCVNSSVEQITGQNSFVAVDENLISEVEEIFKSTSFQTESISGAINASLMRQQSRMNSRDSRPTAAGARLRDIPASCDGRRNQPQRLHSIVSNREMSALNRKTPPSNREQSASNREIPAQGRNNSSMNRDISSNIRDIPSFGRSIGRESELTGQENDQIAKSFDKESIVPDMTQAIVLPPGSDSAESLDLTTDNEILTSGRNSKNALDAAGISAMRGFKSVKKKPPAPKMMTIASTFESPMTDAENSFDNSLRNGEMADEIEEGSTIFFSTPSESFANPKNNSVSNDGAVEGIESSIVEDETQVHYAFDIPWLISMLKMSFVRQKRFTIVCSKNTQDQIVILIAFGRVEWIERVRKGTLPDINAFLDLLPQDLLPRHKISALIKNKVSMRDVFNDPEIMPLSIAVSQMISRQMPDILRYFDGCPTDIFANIPIKWASLGVDRPCIDFNFSSVLFDFLRSDAESVLTPECFPHSRFGARPFRTPLNADISLNAEEMDILQSIRKPMSVAELKASGKKHVSDILYRLVGFEFADIVC